MIGPYVGRGIILWPNVGPFACFALETRSQELQSLDQWRKETQRETQRLIALTGLDCQVCVVHRAYDVEEWAAQLAARSEPRGEFHSELEKTMTVVADRKGAKEVYLLVRLMVPRDDRKLHGAVAWLWDQFGIQRTADRWLGLRDPKPSEEAMKAMLRVANRAARAVKVGGYQARIATDRECRDLIRRHFRPGLGMPWGEPNRPCWGGESYQLVDGVHGENWIHELRIRLDDGQDYWLRTLGFAFVPDRMKEQNADWLNLHEEMDLDDYGADVQLQYRFRVLPHPEAKKVVDSARNTVSEQADHIREIAGAQVPTALSLQSHDVDAVHHDVTTNRSPIVRVWPRLIVRATTRDALREACEAVEKHFKDEMDIRLQGPSHDQVRLFMECIPGQALQCPNLYPQEMPPETLAAGGATVATKLGDEVGPYIGVKAEDATPVHLDPHLGSELARSTMIGVFGLLGQGKSVVTMKTLWWDLMRGASGIGVVPKGLPQQYLDFLRKKGIPVNDIDLADPKSTSLDPYLMLPGFEGARLAGTVLQTLLPWGQPPGVKTSILAACSQEVAKHGENASLMGAVRTLREEHGGEPGVRAAAEVLEFMSRWPVAEALFRPSDKRLDLKHHLTVLKFRNLDLPRKEITPDRWTEEQRIACAAWQGMAGIAKQISEVGGDNHPKISWFDDAHAVLANPDTRGIISTMVVEGRGKYETPIVASQNVTHVLSDSEADENTLVSNMAIAMVFRLTDENEARAACRVLRIPPTEANIHLIMTIGPDAAPGMPKEYSECLLRDLDGNMGRVQIDLERKEIRDAMANDPNRRAQAMLEAVVDRRELEPIT